MGSYEQEKEKKHSLDGMWFDDVSADILNPIYSTGWATNLSTKQSKYFNSNENLGAWFKKYAKSKYTDKDFSWLDSLSDMSLGALIRQNFSEKDSDMFGVKGYTIDTKSALQDLLDASSINLPEPSKSYEDIYNEMSAAIDAENAQAAQIYDQALNYQRNIYDKQMGALDRGYNNLAKQTLAMDYQKNNQLLGSLGNNMNKARQNALEAGASAGVRLANNVNTLLSTQNAQAQQSLATSNNLAQMLMNQRNAAMGLGSNLANVYSTNANQRAGLVQGNFERKQSNADNAWRINQEIYDDKVNRATSSLEGNAFKDSMLKIKQGQPVGTQQTGSSPY